VRIFYHLTVVCKIPFENLHALLKYEQKLKGLFFSDLPCT